MNFNEIGKKVNLGKISSMNFNEIFGKKVSVLWTALEFALKIWSLEILKIFGCLKGLSTNIKKKSEIALAKNVSFEHCLAVGKIFSETFLKCYV